MKGDSPPPPAAKQRGGIPAWLILSAAVLVFVGWALRREREPDIWTPASKPRAVLPLEGPAGSHDPGAPDTPAQDPEQDAEQTAEEDDAAGGAPAPAGLALLADPCFLKADDSIGLIPAHEGTEKVATINPFTGEPMSHYPRLLSPAQHKRAKALLKRAHSRSKGEDCLSIEVAPDQRVVLTGMAKACANGCWLSGKRITPELARWLFDFAVKTQLFIHDIDGVYVPAGVDGKPVDDVQLPVKDAAALLVLLNGNAAERERYRQQVLKSRGR